MIKYRVIFSKIEAIEITRETRMKVFWRERVGGMELSERKEANWHTWHDTWQSAFDRLLLDAIAECDRSQRSLDLANSELQKIRAMKQPATTPTGDK